MHTHTDHTSRLKSSVPGPGEKGRSRPAEEQIVVGAIRPVCRRGDDRRASTSAGQSVEIQLGINKQRETGLEPSAEPRSLTRFVHGIVLISAVSALGNRSPGQK